jgi:serine/threonine protein kinase/formylglycine-generating enzyme required for sulfatase activity/dienelactone hydrolase
MVGTTVSHYKILEKLGGGGMGVVFKAEDTKLKRTVALKFLPPELTRDEQAKTRFVHEAQAASALQHPNICTIHDIDETADHQLFIVMDCYEGETLKQMVERGPLPIDKAIDIATQVAHGLAKAHESGIVHRDIKPANIIITADGVAKILDFGLAKLGGQTQLTKTGSTLGTVAYMSPEQAQGDEIDHRTDIWSLGAMMYEMLTGRLPFRGDHDAATLYSIVNEELQPASKVRPDLPTNLVSILDKMLQKDRGARYSLMKDVVQELSALSSAETTTTKPQFTLKQISRPAFAIPLTFVFLGLCYLLYYWIDRNNHVSWAHNVALPEIIRLVDAGEWVSAYEIAKKASLYIPSDPVLLKYIDESTWIVSFKSVPSGAAYSYKLYSDTLEDWISLGTTPIEGRRIPRGIFRVKVVKDGFVALDRLRDWSNKAALHDTLRGTITMDSVGVLPIAMVRVPGGEFQLFMPGLDNFRAVTTKDYFIDKFEVTNKQFKLFVDSGGYRNRRYWKQEFIRQGRRVSWEEAIAQFVDATGRPGPSNWEVGAYPEGKDNYPAGGISWYEAAAFAEFVGKSLPSIFHWNRAAYTWYAPSIISQSNFSGNGPVSVGSKQSLSFYGTYDMEGNVREWCWNQSKGKRFILGGGWNDLPYSFTDAYTQEPFDRSPTNGFRCVKYLESITDTSSVLRSVEIAHRDYFKEKPVSDLVFKSYLRLYAYDKTPLHEKIEAIDSMYDWIKEFVSFDAAYGNERMMAYIFLPRLTSPPYQTVVLFPGSEVIFTRSSKHLSAGYYSFFVKSGHAFVFPIYKGTFERGNGLNSDTPNETNSYKEHVIQWVKDFSRVIDYLDTRSDIDSGKIAYYGTSWGGEMGGLIPAVELRIKAAILNVGGLILHKAQSEVDPINFVTHIKIPVLMINGKYDQFFPVEASQKPMYKLLGTPREQKKQFIYEASHMVPNFLVAKQSLEWLDRYFGPVKIK